MPARAYLGVALTLKMVYKFSHSLSYCQFKRCVNHWLGDWKIEFEFPAWAQIFFLFSISSRVDTNWVPRIIGQEEKRQERKIDHSHRLVAWLKTVKLCTITPMKCLNNCADKCTVLTVVHHYGTLAGKSSDCG